MTQKHAFLIKTLIVPTAIAAGFVRITIDLVAKLASSGAAIYYSTFFLAFILEIFLIVYLIKEYKRRNKNYLQLKDGLKIAVATMVIIGLLYAVYSFAYNNYVDPSFQTNTAIAWGELFGRGDEVRQEIAKNESQNSPFGIFYVMVQFSFLGLIIGMIASSVFKTKENLN